jgi:hypothetical protein
MTKDEALAAIDRLEQLARGFGAADIQSLNEVRRLVRQLAQTQFPGYLYFHEKLHSIEDWASIGFSTRKHAKYAGGAEQFTIRAMGACSTARGLIEQHWPAL